MVIALTLAAMACSRSADREYELRGQIVAMDPTRQEVTIRHDDIPRFMPGMTMAFKVRDRRLLDGRVPGDLVKATLVVRETDAELRTLERVGFAPPPAPPETTSAVAPGELVRDATFVDQDGGRRVLSHWRGNVLAVTFIYTRCPVPNFCPLMDRHFKAVQDLVRSDDTLSGHVRLLSVSFDPDYDTPAVLSAHAARVGADPAVWSFLTGAPQEIQEFATQFGVSILPRRADSLEIVHNLRTAVIDAEGRLVTILSRNEWTPPDLLTELRKARAGR
jgi:protein SCO1/2